jgi:hypothetical protein
MNDGLDSLFVRASHSFREANPALFASKPQRSPRKALGRKMAGTKQSHERIVLRYRLCRCRFQDPDNAYAATKTLTDLLCRAGILPDDSAAKIRLEVEQQKVFHRADEGTEITISWPTNE